MRISSQMMAEQFLASVEATQSALSDSEQQISTGKAFQTAGQNPQGATQAISLQTTISTIDQYASNASLVQSRLSTEDSTLSSVTNLLNSVRTTAVQAGDGTLSNTDRASLATAINQQLQTLVQLANGQDGTGQYLFSGTANSGVPFVQDATGAVNYQGNSGTRQIQIGSTRFVTDTDSGAAVFRNIPNGNGTFAVSAGAPTASPPVVNTGSGVVGATSVTDSSLYTGDTYQVSFQSIGVTPAAGNSGSATASAPTGTLTPSTAPSTTITFTSPTTYTLTSAGVTSAAQALPANGQISSNGWTTTITGTPVAGDAYTIAAAPLTYSVTDTTTHTVVVPAGTAYSATGQAISVPGAGVQFNLSGTPANGDAFTLSKSTNQSIFATLTSLVNALNTPTTTAAQTATLQNIVNQSLGSIDQAVSNVAAVRTQVGARLNAVTAQDTANSNVKLQLQATLTTVQNTDYAAAITSLSQQQTSLQAAEQSYANLKSLSIFQYLG